MRQEISNLSSADTGPAITEQVIRSAVTVVTGSDGAHPQSLLCWAWAVLKSARGQTISQSGLNRLTGRLAPGQGKAA
ncbi:MAG: hypothetical protein ACI8Q6_002556 [Granulosicoccus sp.]|jgi:hypothetical protein